jgi:hypothetical protein
MPFRFFSSTSQPFNPDVVIADSDEEDEFGEIQRGTVILKSVRFYTNYRDFCGHSVFSL